MQTWLHLRFHFLFKSNSFILLTASSNSYWKAPRRRKRAVKVIKAKAAWQVGQQTKQDQYIAILEDCIKDLGQWDPVTKVTGCWLSSKMSTSIIIRNSKVQRTRKAISFKINMPHLDISNKTIVSRTWEWPKREGKESQRPHLEEIRSSTLSWPAFQDEEITGNIKTCHCRAFRIKWIS